VVPYDCILKANLSCIRIWAKFCQLITDLFVIQPQFNLSKLQLEFLKSETYCNTRVRLSSSKFKLLAYGRKLAFSKTPLFPITQQLNSAIMYRTQADLLLLKINFRKDMFKIVLGLLNVRPKIKESLKVVF